MVAFLLALCSLVYADDAPKAPLEEGIEAPDFTLPSQAGEPVTLSSYRGKNAVVLYFYPKDNTPGCTLEAQDFRDSQESLTKAGAVVLGVSVDDETSHKFFAAKHKLGFSLLADVGGKVARQYGVMGWIMAKRVTFLIGEDGKIVRTFANVNVEGHSREVLRAVEELGGKRAGSAPPAPPATPAPTKRKGRS